MKAIGVLLVVLSLVVAIVPQFTDCDSQGKAIALPNGKTMPMKCHWSGQAELAVAAPLAVVGVLLVLSRRRETIRALALLGIVLGVAVVLVPTGLIGVCSSDMMLCKVMMQPALILAGALAVVLSVVAVLLAGKAAPAPGKDAEQIG